MDLPLSITAGLIEDEMFWKRSSMARFLNCDVSQHGHSWKQLFFERNLQGTARGSAVMVAHECDLQISSRYANPIWGLPDPVYGRDENRKSGRNPLAGECLVEVLKKTTSEK